MIGIIQILQSARGAAKRILVPALFVTCALSPVFGQTALWLETMLDQPAVTWSEAVVFTLEAAERVLPPEAQDAFSYAMGQGWLPKNAAADDPARLEGLSGLLMRAFDMRGGLFYTLTKSPHYAYRELVYQEVVQGRADPQATVSGSDFLFMIGRVLSIRDDDQLSPEEIKMREERETLAQQINVQLSGLSNIAARATTEGVTISLSNIRFLANSAELSDEEKVKLQGIAEILKKIPNKRLLVTGHTALAGTITDRQRTSLDRAQSVAVYIEELGVSNFGDVYFQGYGAERPVADNDTPEGMAANRRVEITILDY